MVDDIWSAGQKKLNMKNPVLSIVFFFTLLTLASCGKDEPSEREKPFEKVNMIIDADLGNCTDDLLALQAAFAFQSKGWCEIKGLISSRGTEKVQRFADCLLHYYNADNVPLGVTRNDESFFEITPYYQLVDAVDEEGNPLLEGTGIPLSERLDGPELYRKLLSEASDHSITIVCIGFTTNICALLRSGPDKYSPLKGIDLIRNKVKALHLMGCCFGKVRQRYSTELLDVEYNILGDIPSAQELFAKWPVEIHVFPVEGGLVFPSDHDEVLSDYSWQPDNPLYLVYSRYDEWHTGDLGQYWWDPFVVLHSMESEELYNCTGSGVISINETGRSVYVADPDGKHYIIDIAPQDNYIFYESLRLLSKFNPNKDGGFSTEPLEPYHR